MAIQKHKKKFFDVEMPIIAKQTQLIAYTLDDLKNRIIKYDLTRFLRGKSVLLNLKVDIEDEKATAHPIELQLMPYFLRRMVRKGTDYVEDSFSADCENTQIAVKPILVTRRKVSKEIRKALRNRAKEWIVEYIKDKNSEAIFKETIQNQIQKQLSLALKKIYPLSLCELRSIKVEKEKQVEQKISKKQ